MHQQLCNMNNKHEFQFQDTMINRKDFLKQSLSLAGGTVLTGSFVRALSSFTSLSTSTHTGLQLFTLRNEIGELGIEKVLNKVAEIGYSEVEPFGYSTDGLFNLKPNKFKQLCDSLKISAPSGHYLTGRHDESQTGTIVNGWEKAIEDAKIMGHNYMVIAWLHPDERQSIAQYNELAEMLNEAGKKCADAGIQLAYHNHDFEFQRLNGAQPYNLLLRETDSELVKMELDLYWITKAGFEPLTYFEKHPGRFPLWHVKDMDKETGSFTEVGNGVINFKKIFAAKNQAGLKHYFVEQDESKHPLKSIETSYNYVTQLLRKDE